MDTNITWNNLQATTPSFTEKLNAALDELGIRAICKDLPIDHICVRLKNTAAVANLKTELEAVGHIISAVQVNGREISIIQLTEPINLGDWQTFGVELPNPKPNHNYEDGWEHVEFVLNVVENTMAGVRQAFIDTFPQLDIEKLKVEYSYSEDEPHAEGDQLPNPTVGLKVNGVGIKFHALPIQKVVGYID
jgi:predicted metalloenzyme YecM